jgi:hypothetical protein
MNGETLEKLERFAAMNVPRPVNISEPVPAHVEVPLLLALCERYNALM